MLQALLRRRVPQDRIASADLLQTLAHLAHSTKREVGVYIDRHGSVKEVVVSRRWQELLTALASRGSTTRSVGLRYVGARPREESKPEDADERHMVAGRLDLAVIVGSLKGVPTEVWLLTLAPGVNSAGPQAVTEGPYTVDSASHLDITSRTKAADAALRRSSTVATKGRRAERAVLVGLARSAQAAEGSSADRKEAGQSGPVRSPSAALIGPTESLEELSRLADTAGAQVVGKILQSRSRPDGATFIGRGKVAEVMRECEEQDADMVIFDEELSPAQQRNLEEELGVKVVDRTALVLDIFARRAHTHEGRLQVELAQHTYMLPRLAGRGVWLSRLGGGIGTRGPGETKLEVDRRRIRDRITDLKRELREVERHRALQRTGRREAGLPMAAIVGYTNAGKSTLLNALTDAHVLVEDKLFATLDPTVRKVTLPNHQTVLLVDTVGFIHKLPTQVVAAFRATLEEAVAADLLVHVVDAAHPRWEHQRAVAEEILRRLGAGDRPQLLVFNKVDLLDRGLQQMLKAQHPDAVLISAQHGLGLINLLRLISQQLPERLVRLRFEVPYAESRRLAEIFEHGRVLEQRYEPEGIIVEAEVPQALAERLRNPSNRPGKKPS